MIFDPTDKSISETHKLMIGSIVPRPIAFVSTRSKDGKNNVAPFSYFNGVCSKPPTIMFAPARRGWDGEEKDTLINIRDTEEFVVNIVSESFAEKMVMCSTDFDSDVDEFDISKLTTVASQKVSPPRVGESKVSFECKLNQIVEIGDGTAGSGFLVIGTIVLFHIDDDVYDNGRILLDKLQPLGRLAGNWYTRTTDTLKIIRKIKPEK
jgi:flavin reductase (DIM6/NTAB) family NADH-FMN oxidoreductase RutF